MLMEHSQNTHKTLMEHARNTHRTLAGHSWNTHKTLIEHARDTRGTLTRHLWNTHGTLVEQALDILADNAKKKKRLLANKQSSDTKIANSNKRSFIWKAIYSEAVTRRIMDILSAQKVAKC